MNLTQIRYFLTLANVLNFTKAAAACHVTQPALTKSIQKLEEELGGPLLLRERNNSQLTDLGAAMVPLLRQTYEAAVAARLGAKQFLGQEQVCLRIGLGPWVPPSVLEPLLRELGPRFPSLKLSVREGRTAVLNEWLDGSQIDVAFTADVDRLTPRAQSWPLFDEEVVAVLHAAHPLAGSAPIPRDLLVQRILVARGGDEDERSEPDTLLGARARICHTVGTQEHLWILVRAGQGMALATARRATPPDIVRRPLDPPQALDIRVASVPGRRTNRAVDAFLRLARARPWEGVVA